MKRAARCLKSVLVRQSIRETLASDTLDGELRTFPIAYAKGGAIVETEIKFSKVAMKVLFLAVLVSAAHTALEH